MPPSLFFGCFEALQGVAQVGGAAVRLENLRRYCLFYPFASLVLLFRKKSLRSLFLLLTLTIRRMCSS